MKTRNIIILAVVIVLIASFLYYSRVVKNNLQSIPARVTHSTKDIVFGVPDDFGFAVNKDQILVHSYIPSCDENFDYCIYYNGNKYEGTNFEAAGVRISKRTDLQSKETCLQTSPEGYIDFQSKILDQGNYSTSVFSPMNNAGAGHFASGKLYRLFVDGSCYEFETRIGQTQFAYYPPGAIKEFTKRDQSDIEARLQQVIDSISLKNGVKVEFPK
jgi:hypothetical protein